MTLPKIVRIDASALGGDSHCIKKLYNKLVLGHTEHKQANDMVYGSCWHMFRENFAKLDGDWCSALSIGVGHFKKLISSNQVTFKDKKEYLTPEHLSEVCLKYIHNYGSNHKASFGDLFYLNKVDDGSNKFSPMVEQTFSINVYQSERLVILLQGTIDEIGRFNNGFHAFGDDKTTSSFKVEKYLLSHKMKPQLITYAWALKYMANNSEYKLSNVLKTFAQQRIGGFINGIFLHKEISKVEFKRSDIFFYSDKDLDEYETLMMATVNRIAYYYENNIIPLREGKVNGTCSGNFGECHFWRACNAPDEISEKAILNSSFPPKDYEPLSFRK